MRRIRPVLLVSTIAAACATVAGCSLWNPYRHAPVLQTSANGPELALAKQQALSALGLPASAEVAGGVLEALIGVDHLRNDYYGDMRGVAITRSATAAGSAVASGWALYNALAPAAAGASAPSTGQSLRALRLGATVATAYALSEFFVNKEQESIYASGYNSLTCLMLQSRPLFMVKVLPPKDNAEAPAYDQFVKALGALKDEIDRVQKVVAEVDAGVGQAQRAGRAKGSTPNSMALDIKEARTALERARGVLQDGLALRHQIDGAGLAIKARAGLIAGAVNAQLQGKQKDLAETKAQMKSAQSIVDAYRSIGQSADTEADADATGSSGAAASPGAAVASSASLVQHALLPPSLSGSIGRATPMLISASAWVAAAAAAAAAPASAAAPAASGASAAAPSAKKVKSNPPAPTASAATLKQELDSLRSFIADPAQQKLWRERDELKEKHKAEIEEKDKVIKGLKAANDLLPECLPADSKACDRKKLLGAVEDLYAARRPVLQTLVNFRTTTRAVRSVSECESNVAGLRIAPSDSFRVKQGDTVEFIVSQSGAGVPMVLLQGNAGKLEGGKANLSTESAGSALKARLVIAANAPVGTLVVLASDSSGKHSEQVRLFVGTAAKVEAPASAASGSK